MISEHHETYGYVRKTPHLARLYEEFDIDNSDMQCEKKINDHRKDVPRAAKHGSQKTNRRLQNSSSERQSSSESLITRIVSSRFVSGHAKLNRVSF